MATASPVQNRRETGEIRGAPDEKSVGLRTRPA